MPPSSRGFSLIETIISIGVLAGAVATLAHLLTVCVETGAAAHHRSMSALLAQQKLEQLRAETTLDESSRADEYLDADGTVVCHGPELCGAAVYLRQWSVHASEIAATALFVHVRARRARHGGGEVHLIIVRPRVSR
jgi:Tfp pilus assembly protein PilV